MIEPLAKPCVSGVADAGAADMPPVPGGVPLAVRNLVPEDGDAVPHAATPWAVVACGASHRLGGVNDGSSIASAPDPRHPSAIDRPRHHTGGFASGSIERDELYPLLFDPIYVNVIWGGEMLKTHFGRRIPDSDLPVGESWEISDRDGAVSVVSNGPLKGKDLRSLIEYYEKSLLGDKFDGGRFPLLIKLIDAGKRLSLQVHPDEDACARIEGAEPKTEMWYVAAAKPGAKIFAGLHQSCTQRQFISKMHSSEIENCLQSFSSRPGDAYFINAGRVHAIGAGNLLIEIQQNSKTTYRISDWGRIDADGKPRQIHLKEALNSINFTDRIPPRISGVSGNSDYNRKFPLINRCPFFRVDELRIVEPWIDSTDRNSFHLLSAINCSIEVGYGSRRAELEPGRTCLIPACFGKYHISATPQDREAIALKTTL